MPGTIVVVGFGPGVSTGVAERFGADGFRVALIARNAARLEAGVQSLKAKGMTAAAFVADAGDPAAIRGAIAMARAELGPISVVLWNAFGGGERIELMTAEPAAVSGAFDVAVVGLLAAVQEALPDLTAAQDGAVLVTNGALGDVSPMMDQFAIGLGAVSVALGNAAKDKLVGLLSAQLKDHGIYVGEVTIAGSITGTPTDTGMGIPPAKVADLFWDLYTARGETRARIS